jgi:hypothetical protein
MILSTQSAYRQHHLPIIWSTWHHMLCILWLTGFHHVGWVGKIYNCKYLKQNYYYYYFSMNTGSFLGVKSGQDVTLTPYPFLVSWSWKSRAMPLLPAWAVRLYKACKRVHFTTTLTITTTNMTKMTGFIPHLHRLEGIKTSQKVLKSG